MPRRPRRRPEEPEPIDIERIRLGMLRTETRGGVAWQVQPQSARAAIKAYTCGGCGGTIAEGVAHVVVWRADSIFGERAVEDRRHWHSGCWRAA